MILNAHKRSVVLSNKLSGKTLCSMCACVVQKDFREIGCRFLLEVITYRIKIF